MEPSGQTILAVARGIVGELDLDQVLKRVLEAVRELTGARYAAIGVLDRSGQSLVRFLTSGLDAGERRRIGPEPTGRGVLGELIADPAPLRLSDVGTHPHSYGFPLGHPQMTTFLGVPLLIDGRPYGNLYLTDKRGGEQFSAEDEAGVVALAEFAALAIDQARRFAEVERQRADLAKAVRTLKATTEITRAVAGELELEPILEMIAKRGRALVGATSVLIELLDRGELLVAAKAGAVSAEIVGHRFDLEGTVAQVTIRTRETQQLASEPNRRRFRNHGAGRFGVTAEDGVLVPMMFRGVVQGVLVALDRDCGQPYGLEEQQLLESFAASAAMAVGTARSADEARRRQGIAAAETERGRWARELHDETLQALAGVRLSLSSARRGDDSTRLSAAVDEAIDQLQLDMDSLRALIADLRPGALDQLGVEPAILDLTGRLAHTGGLEIDTVVDLAYEEGRHRMRLLPELETAIYRTVQESLTNITKHSDATRVVVEVIEDDGAVSVSVRDNGHGFDPAERRDGFGLVGMRERVSLAAGTLAVTSEPGRGTSVAARFPARHLDEAGEPALAPSALPAQEPLKR